MKTEIFQLATIREIGFRIVLIAAGLLFTIAVAEATFRLLPDLAPAAVQQRVMANAESLAVSHPYIGHLHKPNASGMLVSEDFKIGHRTDGYGFRNAWPWPKQVDIVAVGDSLTFGYGVHDNQSWPAILNRALPEIDVLNLGLIGASPQQYLRVYETFGRSLRPRLLLVGFFAGNDFWDAILFDRWLSSGAACAYLIWRDFGRPSDDTRCPDSLEWKVNLFVRGSYVYNLLLEARNTARSRVQSELRTLRLSDGSRFVLDVAEFEDRISAAVPNRKEFHLAVQALRDLQSIAARNETKVLVVLQPSKAEVYLPLLGEPVSDLSVPLREELRRSGIEYLNLTPLFRERAAVGETLFFEVDGHPNAAGYALIADAILDYLKQNATEYGLNLPGHNSPVTLRERVRVDTANFSPNAN
jgi:lysophospholipase L1-like esterase